MSIIHKIWLQIRKHCYLSMCALVVCLGVFYLACATLITIIPHYQQQIAKEFSQILDEPVDFSQIKFSWRGFRIYARVYNVDIGHHDAKIHIDKINKVQFLIHPVKSLIKFKPDIDDVTINGGKIYLSNSLIDTTKKSKQSSDAGILSARAYLTQIFNSQYLKWININQINLRNTAVIVSEQGHKPSDAEHEFLISELNIYNSKNYNYVHGLVYQVNKIHLQNKQREILELALKFNKNKQAHKYYLATNSKGLDHIINDFIEPNADIAGIELNDNTWLKIWGDIADHQDSHTVNTKKKTTRLSNLPREEQAEQAGHWILRNQKIALKSPGIKLKAYGKDNKSKKDIILENINGQFNVSFDGLKNYNIDITKLEVKTLGSKFNVIGNINKTELDTVPNINTIINFGHTDLKQFLGELPTSIIGKDTSSWLKQHVKKGWLGKAEILWRGRLDNSFPYSVKHDGATGIFNLRANLQNTTIDYSPDKWPKIRKLNGVLSMRGRDISIDSTSARVSDSKIKHVHAQINNVGREKHNRLILNGNIISSGKDLHHVIDTTPLKKDLGGVNKNTKFSGAIGLNLDMVIPFSEHEPNKISGEVEFTNNLLDVKDTPLSFNRLNGKLKFDGAKVKGDRLYAKFNNRKAIFNIENKDNGQGTNISLSSWVDAKYLINYYKVNLEDNVKGVAEFDLYINLKNNEGMFLQATSSLIGIQSKLPGPYAKSQKDTRPVKLNIEHDFKYFTKYSVTLNEHGRSNKEKFSRIEYDKFKDHSILFLNTEMLYGKVFFNKTGLGIDVALDYFKIPKSFSNKKNTDKFSSIDGYDFPTLKVRINNLFYGDILLGQSDFEVASTKDKEQKQLFINNFNLNGEILNLKFDAKYTHKINFEPKTEVVGKYNIRNVAQAAKLFDENDLKDKIKIKGDYDLSWPDDILSPKLSTINGKISIKSGFGHIEDIEPGLGRVFSLLDLEAISKRLRLDFSDVFEKGYKFDAIKGAFNIANGTLSTNKTNISASSADIEIYGKIDLNEKALNLVADVMPHVTSALPLAAAVIGTPAAGAAVFLIDKILDSPVNQLTEQAYSISGPWSDPVIESLSSKRGPLIEVSWLNPDDEKS